MKKSSLTLLIVTMLLLCCRKTSAIESVPACIQSNIEQNKSNPNWEVDKIEEYEYQGMKVYLYSPRPYPDAMAAILKSDCTSLCSLGGIAGITMCNGEKFSEKAVFIRTVWKR